MASPRRGSRHLRRHIAGTALGLVVLLGLFRFRKTRAVVLVGTALAVYWPIVIRAL